MEIYVSSLAMMDKSPEEMIKAFKDNNWALEFSSGLPYRDDMEDVYLNAPLKRMPHNYFPAPETPFVLNLASTSDNIRRQSIDHCKRGLWFASKSGSPFYCAHAGFCIDPNPNELGRKLRPSYEFDKNASKSIFIRSINEILEEADRLNIDFLVENNVIASFNIIRKENPLLCCESKDISWLFLQIEHPRLGLLLDTAHLKVSCATLGLDLEDELTKILPFVKGIHHSDNNGFEDDNQPLSTDYWFLPHLRKVKNIVQVLEVKNIDVLSIKQQINLLESNGS